MSKDDKPDPRLKQMKQNCSMAQDVLDMRGELNDATRVDCSALKVTAKTAPLENLKATGKVLKELQTGWRAKKGQSLQQ